MQGDHDQGDTGIVMRAVQELLYYSPTVRNTPYSVLFLAYYRVTGALCTATCGARACLLEGSRWHQVLHG